MQSIDLISSSFSPDCSLSYNISIREYPNGFCLCVYEHSTLECVAIRTTTSLNKEKEPLLNLKYNNTILSKHTDFALVPTTLSDTTQLSSFLMLDKHQKNRANIATATIDNDITLAYNIKKYPNIASATKTKHPIASLINLANTIDNHNICIVEQEEGNISIAIRQNKRLILANTFQYSSVEDAAYYILACYQQLHLDVYTMPLYLCGEPNDIQASKEFVGEYINVVKIVSPQNIETWNRNFPKNFYPMFATQLLD